MDYDNVTYITSSQYCMTVRHLRDQVKLRKHSKQEGVYENTVPPNSGETVKGHISDRAA
ncbi:hypothetical protein YC2023_123147 [Brassica napus]